MRQASVFTVALFIAGFILAACASNQPASYRRDVVGLGERRLADVHQYAPHHNAVFSRPGFREHWSFDTKAKINGGLWPSSATHFFWTRSARKSSRSTRGREN